MSFQPSSARSTAQPRAHHVARPTRRGPSPAARRKAKSQALTAPTDGLAFRQSVAHAQHDLEAPTKLRAGIPFGFARSKLFGVHERDDTFHQKGIMLVDDRDLGIQISYAGPRLNQTHARLWQSLVHLAVTTGSGAQQLVTTRPEVLRAMGFCDASTAAQQWLDKHLQELGKAQVSIKTKRVQYWGQLLSGAASDEAGGLVVDFNPKMALLFVDETVDLYLERKSAYGRDQLAMWLHDFLASQHNEAKRLAPIPVERLHELCGSKDNMREFRRRLRKAAQLLTTGGSSPLLLAWSIDGDVFSYTKTNTHVTLLPKEAQAKQATHSHAERAAQQARERRARVVL